MKSSYKPLGNYIQEVNNRDRDKTVDLLLGVSIQKKFMPSIANTIGTDMSTYKIVKRNQFAYGPVTSRNGDKISIALLEDYDDAIVSQAYSPFEVKDANELLPEYLMMWFRRPEFDRYARFKSHGSAREIFDWEEMCNTLLPVPHITKQREIVKEYNVIQNRIALNQQLIQKLEETAQTIYKQWFVDFEFPDENGKPYKSNDGKMVWNEELGKEIPKGWVVGNLSEIATIIMGQSPEGETYNKECKGMIFYQGRTDFGHKFPDITTYTTHPKKKALKNDILISVRAPVGDLNIAIEDCSIGRGIGALRSKLKCNSHLFYLLQKLKSQFDISDGEGTIFGSINKDDLHNMEVIYSEIFIKKFEIIIRPIDVVVKNYSIENQRLSELKDLLLSKLATVEN
ncbi:MAG: restriction endonuclease subunit S [Candidatus Omnitrophica bacterium]|nr:restriction endonuclease subunit S [Candidatus Omnitrophota bacterium]